MPSTTTTTRSRHKKRRSKRLQQNGPQSDKNGSTKKQRRPAASNMMTDIEEQLQRQRRKRALQEEHETTKKQPPKMLGDYRYDAAKKAYFPKSACKTKPVRNGNKTTARQNDVDSMKSVTSWHQLSSEMRQRHGRHNRIPLYAPQSLLYAAETCPSSRLSCRMRSWCALRQTLYSTKIVPTVTHFNNGWYSMLSPYCRTPFTSDNDSEPWDSTIKSNTMPWAPTFDVSPGTSETKMPAFCTLVEGGCMLRLQAEPKLWQEEQDPHTSPQQYFLTNNHSSFFPAALNPIDPLDFDAIKFQVRNDKLFDNDNYLFGTISRSEHPNKSIFHLFATNEPRCLTTLSCPVNDFSLSIAGTIDDSALAFAPQKCSNTKVKPVFYSFSYQSCFSFETKQFPQSDVLCVEHMMYCPFANLLLYGHRNGQVSLLDSRSHQVVSVLGDKRDFGSVTRILTVPGTPTLLTKGSFGPCHVHDIRKMGSMYTIPKSLRHSLSPPSESLHKTMSSFCSGVAMDPTCKVAISPYANKDREPRLGLWCLDTGAFVGSKRLVPEGANNTTTTSMPYCELSNTITDAYDMSDSNVGRCQGSFGLWLKCGQVEPNAPPKAGSIHHVTIPGDARQALLELDNSSS